MPRAIALASAVAVAFYTVAGLSEAALVRVVQPSETTLDWISDAVLSIALGIAVYLWLHLRATRRALTERERDQLVFHTQLALAEAMQRRLLPRTPDAANGLEWAAMLTPAGRIGGDFFDFLSPNPGVRLMLIADVSGKGIAAAMALTLLRSTFRNVARDAPSLAQLASRMSAAFHDEWHGSPYVTGVIARVDSTERTLTYVNAGHPPGLLIRDDREQALAVGGPPLGLLKRADYDEECRTLESGDVCAFVTDGVTESFDDQPPTLARSGPGCGACPAVVGRSGLRQDHVTLAGGPRPRRRRRVDRRSDRDRPDRGGRSMSGVRLLVATLAIGCVASRVDRACAAGRDHEGRRVRHGLDLSRHGRAASGGALHFR